MSSTIKLLPCPFCSNAEIAIKNENPKDNSGGYFIECPGCGASTSLRFACGDDPSSLLAEQWNRRTVSHCLHQIQEPATGLQQLIAEINQHMRDEWDAHRLPAQCWPTDLARRVRDAAAGTAAAQAGSVALCTCPSGDGSLRWPCPAHPPTAVPAAATPVALPEEIPASNTLWMFLTKGMTQSAIAGMPERDRKVLTERAQENWAVICAEAGATAPVAVGEREAFERELIDNHHYVPSDFSFKDGFYGGDDDYIQFGWDVRQSRAALAATPAAAAPVALPEPADPIVGKLLSLARIVDIAVEDWGESFADGSMEVKFHSDAVTEMDAILDQFDSLPDGPDENVIESGPVKAARILRALLAGVSAPAAQAVPDDWKPVPAHPTKMMVKAARKIDARMAGKRERLSADEVWATIAAALASAPQPPASAPQAQADARDALTDSALLDAMEQKRIAVVPEYEGPWDAEVYNDDGKPNHRSSGSTPREAIRAAIAAQAAQQGDDKQ